MKKLCIYHGYCLDGFASACAVLQKFGPNNIELFPGVYQEPPPDVQGREVIMVDFSYKRDVLIDMASKATKILILDHHETAEQDLVNLPDNVSAIFNMNHSGCVITWNYFFPDKEPPTLFRHIEDRDLWRFNIEHTDEIATALSSYHLDFAVWEKLLEQPTEILAQEGAVILRKQLKDIVEFIGTAAFRSTVASHEVPVLNAPYMWASKAGHLMCRGEKFAACYWDAPEGRKFSLRSDENGMNVAKIASMFGGGGHERAAGFTIRYGTLEKLQMNEVVH